jgi:predicted metal-binding membrane protein
MWVLMMVAMMLPSVAPMIRAYAKITGNSRRQAGAIGPALLFAGLYLAIWTAFSLAAATAQSLLAETGVISAATQWRRNPIDCRPTGIRRLVSNGLHNRATSRF